VRPLVVAAGPARTARVVLAGLAVAVAAVLAAAAPAGAHAVLERMSPAAGSTVTTAPSTVRLYFDENVRSPSKIVVTGPSGRVDSGPTTVVDNTVSVAVKVAAQPTDVGYYRAAYRVVSADGHVVSAEETFRFAPPGVQAAPLQTPGSSLTSSGSSHAWWWVLALALVVVAAGALLVPRRPATRGRRR
jgi:methionine-rich copper-binding protein CopC